MSYGAICECGDERHPFDERSINAELGITNRCRKYAVEGRELCPDCEAEGHVPLPEDER